MQVVTSSKARLGKPPGLVASPRDGEGSFPRKVVESPQGNFEAAGHEQVGSPSKISVPANGC